MSTRSLSITLSLVSVLAVPLLRAQVDVLTHRYDAARSGVNLNEAKLTTANVRNPGFRKLAFRLVDGNVYAQPLIVSGARISGRPGPKNVAIVATAHNSVYAFDADDTNQTSTTAEFWKTGPAVLGRHVEYTEMERVIGLFPGQTCVDLTTEVGIISTPVIRLRSGTSPKEGVIFVVNKSAITATRHVYKIFALSLADGAKISETIIEGDVPGTGTGSNGGRVRFDANIQLNRPALLLHDNVLYIAFGGHCDRPAEGEDSSGFKRSYHGWLFAYNVADEKAPKRLDVYCTTPNGRGSVDESRAGIWMSGHGPAVDPDGNIYFSTGDGTYNGGSDLGNSVVRVKLVGGKIQVQDWYSPQNRDALKVHDADLGAGGVVPVPNSRLVLAGGKEGRMYLIDRQNMGKGATTAVDSFQVTPANHGHHYYNLHGAPVIWPRSGQMLIYVNGEEDPLKQYRLIPDTTPGGPGWKLDSPVPRQRFGALQPFQTSCADRFKPGCISAPYPNFPKGMFGDDSRHMVWMPGGFLSISSNGETSGTGIVWVTMPLAENANQMVVRGVLRAFDATDLSKQLWDSESTGNDNNRLGHFAKFNPPVVANGRVYVGTFQAEMISPRRVHSKLPGGDQPALVIYGVN
jgi:hypothetical protein